MHIYCLFAFFFYGRSQNVVVIVVMVVFTFVAVFPGGCLYICLYAKLLLFSLSLLFASSLFEFE